MKKYVPYLVGLLAAACLLYLVSRHSAPQRRINERITLRQKDKIPYGTFVARSLLSSLFPHATIHYDSKSPGLWDSIAVTSYNQAVLLIGLDFDADTNELKSIVNFARKGNYIYIIARSFSRESQQFFHFTTNRDQRNDFLNLREDSLSLQLSRPVFSSVQNYVYPGRNLASAFVTLDSTRTLVLGRDGRHLPDFIEYQTGNGGIFIHTAPLAFSNYFILHKKNIQYYQQALSVIPSKVERVLWNEYYLTRPGRDEANEPNRWRVLMRYPSFKWGLITGAVMLFLMTLLGSRRKQRMIPEYKKPTNDSLDFVKTVGRLYHDKRDHHNLSKKMAAYFMDHVRSIYKIPTAVLDDQFTRSLQYKSGYPFTELNQIVSFINYLERGVQVNDEQLATFYRQLELFYQNT